jgi:Mrp family chromosome partitioning ATPase
VPAEVLVEPVARAELGSLKTTSRASSFCAGGGGGKRGASATAFRVLGDNLLAKGLPRVLAITSAAPNEGKTTCAANLAFALAEQTTKRLLLVDANFFAPTLANMFSIDEYAPPMPGRGAPCVPPLKLTSLTPCLDLATMVLTRGEPLPTLERGTLLRLLGAFRDAGYDHVILDAPALDSGVAHVLDVADGVLFVARAGQTTGRALRRAVEPIAPSKRMGVALIDDPGV